ncbi:MAG: hypothetical protein GY930_18315 [bacterium]|nr:hypothetical protein [bacterium]
MKVVPLRLLADTSCVRGVRREIEGFRKRLAAFPAQDSNVKLVTSNLDDFEGLLNGGLAKLNGDPGQAADIEKRIESFATKYDRKVLPLKIRAPFTIGNVEAYDKAMDAACVPGPSLSAAEEKNRAFPDRAVQRQRIRTAMTHLKQCAVAALGSVRMPAVASTDAGLTIIAKRVLNLPKDNISKWERMVISRDKRHHERRRGWIEPGSVNTLDLTIYTYTWDDFTVTTAEKRGDELWLFSNQFENYGSGDSTTTTGEWYLAARTELTRILPANLDKPPLPTRPK